jgi:plastocyanin
VTLLLCLGVLSVSLAPPRAASESGPPEGADPQQTPTDCVQTFLNDVQICLLLPENGQQLSCIRSNVQALQTCLSDGRGGEVFEVEATNDLQFVLPDGANNAIVPLVINVGDTVRWTNTETLPHTVTSGIGENDPEVGELFDRFLPARGDFEYTFDTPGTYPYFCRIHDEMNMQGTVVVRP